LTFVDFGMVGRVPANLREGLREMLIGVGTRDAARLVKSYQTLDVLLPGANLKLIEQAEAKMFEIFWGKSMSDLRKIDHKQMHQFAYQFRELMYSMPFQLPENLLLLVRTVAILSGMCTGLDPDFNLWEQLSPYAQKIIAEEATSNWRVWLDELGEIVKKLLAFPAQAGNIMTKIENGELTVQMPEVKRQMIFLEKAVNRLAGGVIFSGLLVCGAIFFSLGERLPGNLLTGAAFVALAWTIFMPTRRGPEQ
jgi:predicted unusual protein kinase regulating ubiquinone biosynthesis (AarF/ABC1/UbiB family)